MKTLLLSFLVLFATPALAASPVEIPSGTTREPAKVYVPDQYSSRNDWPVVLLLHGYLGSAGLIDSYFGFSAQASKRGFILVVPNGNKDSNGERFWNATDGCCDFDHSNVDDLGYLKNLLRDVEARYRVDANRIYVAGHSNGAFMAHRLACEGGAGVAAIASFAGAVSRMEETCARPVSVLQIHAFDDDTIHYDGDPKGYPKLAPYPGVKDTIAHWLRADACAVTPKAGRSLNLTLSIPGNDADESVWTPCANGTNVTLWTIHAYKSLLHTPHTPLLTQDFTDQVLDYLLAQKRAL